MTSLQVAGVEVARYGWDVAPPSQAVARPALHPLRTLRGSVVTAEHPPDHPWHRGIGIALPDVDGVNLWGGPTYLADAGYRPGGHGRVRQSAPLRVHADGVEDSLAWCDSAGTPLLHESRRLIAGPWVPGCWSLEWSTALSAAGPRDVRLHSPGSRGRAGAGYGGFFWRLPLLDAAQLRVFTADGAGECAVHGRRAPWIAASLPGWTVVLAATNERTAADPWFVRVAEYAALGSALAWDRPLTVSADRPLRIGIRVLLADRACDRAQTLELLERVP